MKFDRLTPILWTNELPATIEFYTTTLGFELDEYNADWAWCHLHKDGVNMMFSKPNEHTPHDGSPKFTGSFYVYVEAVDELWQHLQSKVKISYNIGNFEHGMREFAIYDNNGYLLQFGRAFKEGETVDKFE